MDKKQLNKWGQDEGQALGASYVPIPENLLYLLTRTTAFTAIINRSGILWSFIMQRYFGLLLSYVITSLRAYNKLINLVDKTLLFFASTNVIEFAQLCVEKSYIEFIFKSFTQRVKQH